MRKLQPLPLIDSTKWSCNVYVKRYIDGIFIYSEGLQYHKSVVLKYCITEFVHAYQATTSLAKTRKFFQSNFHIFKLLIILFISVFDMQYWKSKNICNAWNIEGKLKIWYGLLAQKKLLDNSIVLY